MSKMAPEILQQKIETLDEYHSPGYRCSLFLLPNGRMFGSKQLYDHKNMLETILKIKVPNEDVVTDIITKSNISRIISHNQLLSVYLSNYPTHAQRKTLCELVDSGYYDHFNFDCAIINDDRNALLRKLRLALHMPI